MEALRDALSWMWQNIVRAITVGGIVAAIPIVWRGYVWWQVRRLWPTFQQTLKAGLEGRTTDVRIAFHDLQTMCPRIPRKVLRELWNRIAELPYATCTNSSGAFPTTPRAGSISLSPAGLRGFGAPMVSLDRLFRRAASFNVGMDTSGRPRLGRLCIGRKSLSARGFGPRISSRRTHQACQHGNWPVSLTCAMRRLSRDCPGYPPTAPRQRHLRPYRRQPR